jgi:hypothetical protein
MRKRLDGHLTEIHMTWIGDLERRSITEKSRTSEPTGITRDNSSTESPFSPTPPVLISVLYDGPS